MLFESHQLFIVDSSQMKCIEYIYPTVGCYAGIDKPTLFDKPTLSGQGIAIAIIISE